MENIVWAELGTRVYQFKGFLIWRLTLRITLWTHFLREMGKRVYESWILDGWNESVIVVFLKKKLMEKLKLWEVFSVLSESEVFKRVFGLMGQAVMA